MEIRIKTVKGITSVTGAAIPCIRMWMETAGSATTLAAAMNIIVWTVRGSKAALMVALATSTCGALTRPRPFLVQRLELERCAV